jgi:phosphoglycolate phosphatase
MSRPMPCLVVFDLAGTTLLDDGAVAATFRAVLDAEHLGHGPEAIQAVRGASKRAAFLELAQDPAQAERLLTAFLGGLRRHYAASPAREVPGASAVFAWLRERQAKIALNTGLDRKTVEDFLASLGWDPAWFSAVVCGDDVPVGRPAPAMVLDAMRKSGVTDPASVMVVGDTELDLQAGAAAKAGWIVGVTSGAHGYDRLLQAPHTHLVASVADIREVLR